MTRTSAKTLRRTRAPYHAVVYANQINSTGSDVDVRLRFGLADGSKDVVDQVDVVMNPIVAIKLRDLLTVVIEHNYAGIYASAK